MSTYWIADNEQFPQSLTVDLEEVCTLSGIQQIFKDHDSWKFKIEGSNDELHWAVLVIIQMVLVDLISKLRFQENSVILD